MTSIKHPLMTIEQFVSQSEGQWRSMRSGHSIAFKQFEQVVSKINVKKLNTDDTGVKELLSSSTKSNRVYKSPFLIEWTAETDWGQESTPEKASGSRS